MIEIDENILLQLQKGKKEALEMVFKSLYHRLHVYATGFVKDNKAAEDIVQDVFYAVWLNRDKLDMNEHLKAYLFRSVQNKSFNYLEHLKIMESYTKYTQEHYASNLYYLHSLSPDSDTIMEKELDHIITETIKSFPQQCKKIFTLSRFSELKNREIAAKLSISIKAVEKQITFALSRLRLACKDYLK